MFVVVLGTPLLAAYKYSTVVGFGNFKEEIKARDRDTFWIKLKKFYERI